MFEIRNSNLNHQMTFNQYFLWDDEYKIVHYAFRPTVNDWLKQPVIVIQWVDWLIQIMSEPPSKIAKVDAISR